MYFLHPVKMEKIKEMMKADVEDRKIVVCRDDVILDGNHRIATFMVKNKLSFININDIKNEFDIVEFELTSNLAHMLYQYYTKGFKVKKILNPINGKVISVSDIPKEIEDLDYLENIKENISYEYLYCKTVDELAPIPVEAEINYSQLRDILHFIRKLQEIDTYRKKKDRPLTKEEFEDVVNKILEWKGKFILDIWVGSNYTNPDEWIEVTEYGAVYTGNGCLEGMDEEVPSDIDYLYNEYLYVYEKYNLIVDDTGIRIW